ncbi:hypothetical protein VCB98_11815 [Gammaproteobacteria bacterium AB-CW1]|uniref:Endonuclease/exonuclease/phosphatase domain-containing protein n=1 Tax=Natronospira elongata TaxID=3110268 RepID=A0AAP6MKK4_9GAMM|nr:hypothetical protein [Gammaproteobacteria bacterium AB-CW1]
MLNRLKRILRQLLPEPVFFRLRRLYRAAVGRSNVSLNSQRGRDERDAQSLARYGVSHLSGTVPSQHVRDLDAIASDDFGAAAELLEKCLDRANEAGEPEKNAKVWLAAAKARRLSGDIGAGIALLEMAFSVCDSKGLVAARLLSYQARAEDWLSVVDRLDDFLSILNPDQQGVFLRKLSDRFLRAFRRKNVANEVARRQIAGVLIEAFNGCGHDTDSDDLVRLIALAEYKEDGAALVEFGRSLEAAGGHYMVEARQAVGVGLYWQGKQKAAAEYLLGIPSSSLSQTGKRARKFVKQHARLTEAADKVEQAVKTLRAGRLEDSKSLISEVIGSIHARLEGEGLPRTISALAGKAGDAGGSLGSDQGLERVPVFCAGFRWSGGSAVYDYLCDLKQTREFWKKPRFVQGTACSIDQIIRASQEGSDELSELVEAFVLRHVIGVDPAARKPRDQVEAYQRSLLAQIKDKGALASLEHHLSVFVAAVKKRAMSPGAFPQAAFEALFQHLLDLGTDGEAGAVLLDSMIRASDAELLEYFPHARLVAVTRDPRDMYATHVERGGWRRGVDDYISRLKADLNRFDAARERFGDQIELVRFEQFVKSEPTRKALIQRLALADGKATAGETLKSFRPEESLQNIGIHGRFSDQAAIRKIEKAFPELCHLPEGVKERTVSVCTFSAMATKRQQDGDMVLCGSPGDPGWKKRREITARFLAAKAYDFFGLQHCYLDPGKPTDAAGWFERRLREKGVDYGVINRAHGKRPDRGDSTPLFYRKDRWRLDESDSGSVAYRCPAPDRSEPGGGGTLFIYGLFHEVEPGGESVYVYNFRLRDQHTKRNDEYRAECLRELFAHIADRQHPEAPVILLGDTNCKKPGSKADKLLLGRSPFSDDVDGVRPKDAYLAVHPNAHGKVTTQHNFKQAGSIEGSERNDRVLFFGELEVMNSEILTVNENGQYPSYHYPVEAVFRLS